MESVLERVESLAKSGKFGKKKFLRTVVDPDAKAAPNFASRLGFYLLEFESEEGITRMPLVAKIQPKTEFERTVQNSDNQFLCEVTMYTEILPKLGADKLGVFPKFCYGEASSGKSPETDIVIMEDLRSQGYTTADELFLSSATISMILKKLGEFHGLTYHAKVSHQDDILALGKSLPQRIFMDDFNSFSIPCIQRGFKAASSKFQSPVLERALDKILQKTPVKLWAELLIPVEPFSTIIHGDFNKNNLMFKFNKNKEVENVKFLDFQTSLYSDPTVDISFLLYMNTTQETRDAHWDEFLRAYWEGVTSKCPSPGFTFDEFLVNFGTRAIIGYIPCSFFLPNMIEPKQMSMEEFSQFDADTQREMMIQSGGQKGTDAIGDIVKDLLDRGYLELFLDRI